MVSPAGAERLRWTFHLLIAAALAVPSAAAWTIDPTDPSPEKRPAAPVAAWTTDLAPSAFPGNAAAAAKSAVGCALGDVSGDGVADLLVLVADPASGVQRLQALAGPGFQRVVWEKVGAVGQVLQCAPDLDLDGTLDPIVQTLGDATGTAAAGAGERVRHQVQQVLDGASGAAMLGRIDAETVTGVTGAASTGLAAGQQATSVLLPAAAGAAGYLKTSATDAILPLPVSTDSLPIGSLTATASQAAELQILDVTGSVVATISIDEAGIDPVALSPVQLTGALPDVAVLSMAALSPVQEATAGIPELALYTADGTLAWATQLPASTGVPLLVPNVGDLDLDGVGDLVVTTVEQQVQAAPAAAYTVVSGVDGSILFTSGPAVSGLVAALPLGELPEGTALLEAVQVEGAARLTLSALDGAGSVLWSVDVDGLARPVNMALDAYTGDILGFTDLTGDAIPDVAVLVETGTGIAVQAIDGATGSIAWDLDLPDVSQVIPVVIGLAQAAEDVAGGVGGGASAQVTVANLPGVGDATDLVEETVVGGTSALLALGHSSTNATLVLVDALAGEVVWTAMAELPASFDVGSLRAQVAGDLDADQVQDLLVSVVSNATAAAEGAAEAAGGTTTGTAAVVSGATGETLWTKASAAAAPGGLEFESSFGPASAAVVETEEGNRIPGPGPALVALALVVGVALRRRRD